MPKRSRRKKAYNLPPNRRNERNPSPDSPSSGSQTSDTNTETTPDNASSSASATSTTTDSRPRRATISYHDNANQAKDARGEPVAELNNDVFEDGPRAPRDAAEMKWYSPLFTTSLSGGADMQDGYEVYMWDFICLLERASREEEWEDCNYWE